MELLILIIITGVIMGIVWFIFGKGFRQTPINYTDNKTKMVSFKSNIKIPEKKQNNQKIEAVIVCVGYADFLRWTLPFNRNHFDKLVVVTSPEDAETQHICSFWNVQCVTTNSFYANNDKFNKANGINYGLESLDKDGWVVHLDADIFLPPRTRQILNLLDLDDKSLYSCDRLNCNSFAEWIMFLENPENQHSNTGLLTQNSFENGARLLNLDRDGYVPIGYVQIWNPIGSGVYQYPNQHGSADRTDVLFSYNWKRRYRQLLPEIVAIHLQTEETQGVNWNGRKSKRFGLK